MAGELGQCRICGGGLGQFDWRLNSEMGRPLEDAHFQCWMREGKQQSIPLRIALGVIVVGLFMWGFVTLLERAGLL